MNADALRLGDEDAAARAAAKGGDQPVELHAPSESHKTVQAALDEAYAYAPGGATVFVRRGRVDEEALVVRGAYFGTAPLLICGELVAAAPRETFFTKEVVVKGPCRLRHLGKGKGRDHHRLVEVLAAGVQITALQLVLVGKCQRVNDEIDG